MEKERIDKELYSYKEALSQPYWVQKFNDEFSLKQPMKFSRIVYFLLLALVFWFVLDKLFPFLPFGLRGIAVFLTASNFSSFLSNVKVDGKALIFYIRDYLMFYFVHGISAGKQYINKGQIYEKPLPDVKVKKKE